LRRVVVGLFVLLPGLAAGDEPAAPWHRRRTGRVPVRRTTPRVDLAAWPAEPASPRGVAEGTFARALEKLCVWIPQERADRYAGFIVRAAREFDVDPFLLGAIVFESTACRNPSDIEEGFGLTRLPRQAYEREIRGGRHSFQVLERGAWRAKEQRLDRFPFGEGKLRNPESNLYFSAAILAMWKAQHPDVDRPFDSIPHRHFVSHWKWADKVWTTDFEESVLVQRRRLLRYGGMHVGERTVPHGGLVLGSPLDGAPRVVVSDLGDARTGERQHRGTDLEAAQGEPVRSVADGRVSFAGVDRPGHGSNESLTPREAQAIGEGAMGPGGRFVCVSHAESLRTCYMHLDRYEVEYGDRVRRGQEIGTVGRTGVRDSPAHLHLEVHEGERVQSAREVLGSLVVDGRDMRRRRR